MKNKYLWAEDTPLRSPLWYIHTVLPWAGGDARVKEFLSKSPAPYCALPPSLPPSSSFCSISPPTFPPDSWMHHTQEYQELPHKSRGTRPPCLLFCVGANEFITRAAHTARSWNVQRVGSTASSEPWQKSSEIKVQLQRWMESFINDMERSVVSNAAQLMPSLFYLNHLKTEIISRWIFQAKQTQLTFFCSHSSQLATAVFGVSFTTPTYDAWVWHACLPWQESPVLS